MEDIILVEVFESLCDLFGHSLLILESSGYIEQICDLEMEIHDNIDLVIQICALWSLLVNDVIALDDVSMVQALKACDFSQATEIYADSIVDVGGLIELHCHIIGTVFLFLSEEIVEEVGADTFFAFKEEDLAIVT